MPNRWTAVMIVWVALASLSTLLAPPAEALVDGELDFSEQTTLLGDHNSLRAVTANGNTPSQPAAANMNKLSWDNGLAAVAQAWADQCIFAHNPNADSQLDSQLTRFQFDPTQLTVGENLYASSAAATLPTLQTGIQNWYDEYSDYTYSSQSCSGVCGHYTQVVWANTRYVGCGWKLCPTLANTSLSNAAYLVCDYESAGNVVGQDPYPTGTACTQCDSDRVVCDGGLCDGCASTHWDFCSDSFSNCASLAGSCPTDCDLSNPHPLCTGCRTTCGTCTAAMLQPEAACVEVPIPCSLGCDAFDECLGGTTLKDLTCDSGTGFCVAAAVSCDPSSCASGACVSALPTPSAIGSVSVAWTLVTTALLAFSHRRWRS